MKRENSHMLDSYIFENTQFLNITYIPLRLKWMGIHVFDCVAHARRYNIYI